MRSFHLSLNIIIVLALWASGCRAVPTSPPSGIVGRWEVESQHAMNVPNSFFWFSMDYIEFHDDGRVQGLILWPPDGGSELHLNVSGTYTLTDINQITFVGSCRYEDPCTGIYNLEFDGNSAHLYSGESAMRLTYAGPPSDEDSPPVPGPMPTLTPGAIK